MELYAITTNKLLLGDIINVNCVLGIEPDAVDTESHNIVLYKLKI